MTAEAVQRHRSPISLDLFATANSTLVPVSSCSIRSSSSKERTCWPSPTGACFFARPRLRLRLPLEGAASCIRGALGQVRSVLMFPFTLSYQAWLTLWAASVGGRRDTCVILPRRIASARAMSQGGHIGFRSWLWTSAGGARLQASPPTQRTEAAAVAAERRCRATRACILWLGLLGAGSNGRPAAEGGGIR